MWAELFRPDCNKIKDWELQRKNFLHDYVPFLPGHRLCIHINRFRVPTKLVFRNYFTRGCIQVQGLALLLHTEKALVFEGLRLDWQSVQVLPYTHQPCDLKMNSSVWRWIHVTSFCYLITLAIKSHFFVIFVCLWVLSMIKMWLIKGWKTPQ